MSEIRRGVYILPNLFTAASLFCGFYAIIHAFMIVMRGGTDFGRCAFAIILAAIFDGMDGRVARRTKTESRFGMEFDSLSDLVSFGVAPAFILYAWALREFDRIGWLACFLYLACGALRLARFNVQAKNVESRFFQGLPIPMAALMMVGSVLIWDGETATHKPHFLLLTYLLALLMVSNIRYRSFKSLNLTRRHSFSYLVLFMFGLTIWATRPWWVLYLIGCIYLLSGPIEQYVIPHPVRAYKKVRKKRRVKKSLEKIDRISSESNVHEIR